eukprot:TRINITY_DN45308_c0_g1_i3.p2 TRINITY_DN45308_c0_g1~~TRINITY_DN45308_c0_g1_i3.p2  ORF type:complete len:137 (+),score=31.81 TRINITY_DN45308_c0_g1_i3:110-520(+)
MFSFLGIIAYSTPFSLPFIAEKFLNLGGMRKVFPIIRKHVARSLVVINSFIGLEQTRLLPPFVTMTGPLEKAEQAAAFPAAEHPDLYTFLDKAEKVIYVTTGSLARLQPWLVEAMFHGLRKAGHSIVWSLKEDAQQ